MSQDSEHPEDRQPKAGPRDERDEANGADTSPEPANQDSDETSDLEGVGQEGTAEPQEGVGEFQGGGIEGAIGGGQSGQGGG